MHYNHFPCLWLIATNHEKKGGKEQGHEVHATKKLQLSYKKNKN
jgi:hypothetical protein